jgi:hypothetical protein
MQDLELVENDPKYTFEMSTWYSSDYNEDTCYICHAGAVMANTLKLKESKKTFSHPDLFDNSTRDKLIAIDAFREGNLTKALEYMKTRIPRSLKDIELTYNLCYWSDIENKILNDFEEFGVCSSYTSDTDDLNELSNEPIHREVYKNYICGLIGILQAEGL